ncbi:MAG: sulfate ABC transporter permease subunit CysT [Moraxellaceae bacterium]|nr:sulfate ABC transporter permease subunit CysT [Moraxellaceae bacterium]MDZ4387567.1 sulfate ABC transporter permease subunit CysT [Moraxellaceae bacterium]
MTANAAELGNSTKRAKPKRVIPGFGLTLGYSITYLSLLILIPLALLFVKASGMTWTEFHTLILSERVLSAYRVSFGAAFIAAAINAVFGFLVAWVLVRYDFTGRKIVDALVDLPFALPTAVAGISLTALYAQNGFFGSFLANYDIKVAFTPTGIVVALTFISLPFVVRTVQPVLADIEAELEEAAASLGASRWQSFKAVIFPAILPALITGFALAFARAIGEYGSVIFIAGNMPYVSEIAPLLIVTQLEQYNYEGAAAIAAVMLVVSFVLLLIINSLQSWVRLRTGKEA